MCLFVSWEEKCALCSALLQVVIPWWNPTQIAGCLTTEKWYLLEIQKQFKLFQRWLLFLNKFFTEENCLGWCRSTSPCNMSCVVIQSNPVYHVCLFFFLMECFFFPLLQSYLFCVCTFLTRIFTAIMPMVAAGLIPDDPTLQPIRRLVSLVGILFFKCLVPWFPFAWPCVNMHCWLHSHRLPVGSQKNKVPIRMTSQCSTHRSPPCSSSSIDIYHLLP